MKGEPPKITPEAIRNKAHEEGLFQTDADDNIIIDEQGSSIPTNSARNPIMSVELMDTILDARLN